MNIKMEMKTHYVITLTAEEKIAVEGALDRILGNAMDEDMVSRSSSRFASRVVTQTDINVATDFLDCLARNL